MRYREALWTDFANILGKGETDIDLAILVYRQIKKTNQGIRSPHSLVTIKREQSELRPGEVVYTPPRGKGIVELKMENLFEFLNDNKKYPLDPLLKMVIAHYQFEAIHPFTDGNGRTGSVLNLLYLINQGLLSHPVLYLSKYIIQNKNDYYYNLSAVTQRNLWKNWILFMLDAVEKTSLNTDRLIHEIIMQMNTTYDYVSSPYPWYTKELNEVIFSQPYIKQAVIGKTLGKKSRNDNYPVYVIAKRASDTQSGAGG